MLTDTIQAPDISGKGHPITSHKQNSVRTLFAYIVSLERKQVIDVIGGKQLLYN